MESDPRLYTRDTEPLPSLNGHRRRPSRRANRPADQAPRSRRLASVVLAVTAVIGLVAGLQFAANRPTSADTPAAPASAPAQARPETPSPTNTPSPPARTYASSAEVPDGAPVPVAGSGVWTVVPGTSGVVGSGRVRTYRIEIEQGVTPPEGAAAFAQTVQATLADPRSWSGGGNIAVRRIDSGEPALHIRLASQRTARLKCGYEIPIDVSCRNGDKVYLSGVRWIRGALAFDGDLASYRQYMVNHEVGHFFGKRHRPCDTAGGPAPVMMQQTFSTSNNEILDITAEHPQGVNIPRDGKVCTPNPWPFP